MFLDRLERAENQLMPEGFPGSIRVLGELRALDFSSPVTFFIGENGSGKSTLLETIGIGVGAVAVGSADLSRDSTLAAQRSFAKCFRFVRRHAPKTKMFFRAEDAFGFTKRVIDSMAELTADADYFRQKFAEGSYAQKLAVGAVEGQRGALAGRYGKNPDGFSHGETFLSVLKSRIVPNGLYLLDEPETPLSPARVLALMAIIADGVKAGSQFIIATHSPVLMALPDAEILEFAPGGINKIAWEETEHVRLTRSFLNDPQNYLRRLEE